MYKLAVLASAVSALSLSQGPCYPNEGYFKKIVPVNDDGSDMYREMIICVDKQRSAGAIQEILLSSNLCYSTWLHAPLGGAKMVF